LEHVWPPKHLFGWTIAVRLGKRVAFRPCLEVGETPPPRLHLVVTLHARVGNEAAPLVIELDWSRTMHFVTYETWSLIYQVPAVGKTLFKVRVVTLGNWNSVRDHDHWKDTCHWVGDGRPRRVCSRAACWRVSSYRASQ